MSFSKVYQFVLDLQSFLTDSRRSISNPLDCQRLARHQNMICDECEESQAFPKDIIELESTLGISRDLLTADMEKGKRCIVCGSILEEKIPAAPIKRKH